MSQAGRVFVTGSAGWVGQAVVRELKARGHAVRGFDLVATPGLEDHVVGSITDAAALERAMAGVSTLIHLAATPDEDDFLTRLVPNNIVGLYQVMEAARHAGVRRLILASSGQVVHWKFMRGQAPIRVDEPPAPRAWYAATKVFLEAAGRAYAEAYGLSVIVVRVSWCPRSPAQVKHLQEFERGQDVYLSPGDAGRFFARAVEAPDDLRFAVVFATSIPARTTRYDLEPARKLLGYEPRDRWPEGTGLPEATEA